jgi:hypothetical protein
VVFGLRHVALFAVSITFVVGCSGGEDDALPPAASTVEDATTSAETPSVTVDVEPPPLSHEQFIARLDRICRRGNRALVPHGVRYEAATTRGDYDAAADILEEVQELNAPVYARIVALDYRSGCAWARALYRPNAPARRVVCAHRSRAS